VSPDLDLQTLRRAAALEPESASARLALGLGLARAGSRDDAVEALYRARVLGADAAAARAALRELGAPASPWTHVDGDAARTRSAPVSGPRKGEPVLRARGEVPRNVVIDEDGTVLGATSARLWRYGKKRLDEAGRWGFPDQAGVVAPVVGLDGRVLALAQGDQLLRVTSADRSRFEPGPLGDEKATLVAADSSGLAVSLDVALATFTTALAPRARFALPQISRGGFALRAGRAALVVQPNLGVGPVLLRLTVVGLDGNEHFGVDFAHWVTEPAFSRAGEVVIVAAESRDMMGPVSVRRYDREGKLVSRCALDKVLIHGSVLALAPDGAAYLLHAHRLARVEVGGKLSWQNADSQLDTDGGLVLDRDGWAYAIGRHRGSGDGLVAVAPDGAVAFFVPDVTRPLAIDAWGRLLALRGRELVAIG
jgi:hypothetical protein